MKTCTTCGSHKSVADFQKRTASKDGLTSSCKQCLKARDAARYPKEKARRAAGCKAYVSTAQGAAASAQAKRKWAERNVRKRAAQIAVNNAIKSGFLIRWPVCAVPECSQPPEAHHPDYDQPLSVVWLCPAHHKQAHAQQRRIDGEQA